MLEVDIHDTTAAVVLNRPDAKNALSPELLRRLIETCERLGEEDDVRVVVLRGCNGAFCAGADVMGFMAMLGADDPEPTADLGRRAANALAGLPQITVAAIEGHCIGGGVVLAGACDLRLAAPDAWFSIPELELGIPLAWGGMERLGQLIGETAATELVLSCRRFDVEEARDIGFVSTILEGEFDEALTDYVKTVASRPAGVLRATKHQLLGIRDGTFDAKSDAHALLDALHDPETQQAAQDYITRRMGQ
jgi:enoyl-CoA hydratase/carnithine racemase